jgi:hypothetical protein
MLWLLKRSMITVPPRDVSGVRRVVYSNSEDILPLLLGQSLLRAAAPEFKPKGVTIPETAEAEEPEEDGIESVPDAIGGEGHDDLVNVTQIQTFTQQEKQAARTIQAEYRRYLREKEVTGSARDAARKVYFEQCRNQAENMCFAHPSYRLLFLGPLAHALLCIDKVQQAIFAAKKKAKSQLLDVKHEDLEDIRARQTNSKAFFLPPVYTTHSSASKRAV